MEFILPLRDNIIVQFKGLPDWDNLLASASISEGVFYGIEKGGMIIKAHNEYDTEGRRTYAVAKIYKFDSEGKLYSTELIKERFLYNKDGKLISHSTSHEIDGRLVLVRWITNVYGLNGKLISEIRNELRYGEDGRIESSRNEQTLYDAEGREIRYTLTEYAKSTKTRSIKRESSYNSDGVQTRYACEERYYDTEGRLSSEMSQLYTFDDQTGNMSSSYFYASYDENGNVTSSTYSVNEEKYENGRIVMRRSFYRNQMIPQWGPFQGQLTTTYESEDTTLYEYDSDGALVKEHNYGYWFSTYIDPYFDKLTTFLYNTINGVKNLINKHLFHIVAEDRDFTKVTYTHEEDVLYTYDEESGNLLTMTTSIVENNYNTDGKLYYRRERVTKESFVGGHTILNSWTDFCYDVDGNLNNSYRHEDEEQYDESGRLIKRRWFQQHMTRGQVTYEREDITDYEYDAGGDLVKQHNHGYWFSTYVDPWFDNVSTWLYQLIDGVKSLINSHVTNITSQDEGFTQIIYYYDEDTNYSYVTIDGKVLMTGLTITSSWENRTPQGVLTNSGDRQHEETWEHDEKGNLLVHVATDVNREYNRGKLISTYEYFQQESNQYDEEGRLIAHSGLSRSASYDANGNLNWGSESLELATYTYHENGQLATMSRHHENSSSWWYDAEDEFISYNEQGNLLLHTIASTNGRNYFEERTYAEDGKTLLTVDIVSDNPLMRVICYTVLNSYWMKVGDVNELKLIGRPYFDMFGHYELHEKYRPEDGKIAYREEIRKHDGYGYYWWYQPGPYSSRTVETWQYADNGSLIHYERVETVSYPPHIPRNGPIEYLDGVEGDVYLESIYAMVEYTFTTARDYDPDTGKLVREEYSVKGNQQDNWGIMREYVIKLRNDISSVPEDLNALINGVTNFFFNIGQWTGYSERKMSIEYGDNEMLINCVVNDAEGNTIAGFFGTVTHKDGKIIGLTFSYTGDWQEQFKDMLLSEIRAIFLERGIVFDLDKIVTLQDLQEQVNAEQNADVLAEVAARMEVQASVVPGCGMANEDKDALNQLQ